MPQMYCLLVSAAAGAAALALEVLAARVMAPALGSGAVTWSALLAVALGMLAVGNLAGGFLSERLTPCAIIAWSLAASSASLVLLSQFHAPAMRWLTDSPLLIGALAAALITQGAPLGMLGVVTPVILRAGRPIEVCLDNQRRNGHHRRLVRPSVGRGAFLCRTKINGSGRWAGTVLAAGSSGGIAGALGAGLFLLPGVGLTRSYLAVAAILALLALPAIWPKRRWLAAGLLFGLLAIIAVCWHHHRPGPVIESRYGQLEVRDIGLSRVLLIDGLPQTGLPTQFDPRDVMRHGYLLEASLMRKPKISRALVIGLGAGLAPRILAAHGIDCDSVEIDPKVVEIARDKFSFEGHVTLADGRAFLTQTSEQYDLIFLDVCTSDRLAWHLFTVEGLQILKGRLSPAGIAVIQFIGDDSRWSACLAHTVETVFGNSLMLAARRDAGRVGPRWLFATCGTTIDLREDNPVSPPHAPWHAIQPNEPGALLTDDHFPAELDWASTVAAWRSFSNAQQ